LRVEGFGGLLVWADRGVGEEILSKE
jgi:hypothetical protein